MTNRIFQYKSPNSAPISCLQTVEMLILGVLGHIFRKSHEAFLSFRFLTDINFIIPYLGKKFKPDGKYSEVNGIYFSGR